MWHTKNIKEVEKELRTNIKTGLGDKDVLIRQDEFGKNKIEEGKKESLLVKFINQFKEEPADENAVSRISMTQFNRLIQLL